MKTDDQNLIIMRHSCAHLMAAAIQKIWPEAKFGVGPSIVNGFYYDVEIPGHAISVAELGKIEKQMKKMISLNLSFEKKTVPLDEAIKLFNNIKQNYKVELLNDLKIKGTTAIDGEEKPLSANEPISLYQTGDFIDLCRGPHIATTKEIKIFKLLKVAGAYWRGDEKNPMLTRIYGTCFNTQEELDQYLHMLEEAAKRDHRKLGKELELFTFSEIVGKGLPLWTEKGTTIRRELERFIIDEEIKRGYKHVYTPDIARLALYEKSGHYPYYKDSMYAPIKIDDEEFMLRPMACPHHFELYLSKPRSYKELPMRIAEIAKLYRYEQSGELTGLIRVRNFCLADSHIVCADYQQAKSEINNVLDLIEYVSTTFGFVMGQDYWYRLSLGDRSDEKKYYKNDEAWEIAEENLRQVLKERKSDFVEAANEAAFYGPKIDVQMRNVSGKEDTAFTVQYDFVMPERFNLIYNDKDGQEKKTIVIHRSSIGAIERVIAFLIERYAGNFPTWLSPIQIALLPVGGDHKEYCYQLANKFREYNFRVQVDDNDETVGNKIRKATGQKIPYILVIGDKEIGSDKLNIRLRGSDKILEITENDFVKRIKEEISTRKDK